MSMWEWLVIVTVLATFAVETGFLYVMTAKRTLDAGVALPLEMKLLAYFWLAVGVPADVLFNWIRGTIAFREWPQELMFTSRVQRHVRGSGWRKEKALGWAAVLNAIDPGHIKL